MITRRRFAAGMFGAALAPLAAFAQQGKLPRVGVLWHAANAEEEGPYFRGLMRGFDELGYVHGRNVILEHRFPNEIPERFAAMAAELVSLKVDVLVGVGAQSSIYAKNATSTIPVIFMYVPDPVGAKLVQSLARPGGNTTGLTNSAVELTAKRLQYLKELMPRLSRVALLVNPNAKVSKLYVEEALEAAPKFGLSIHVVEAATLGELDKAFDAMTAARAQALTVNSEGLFFLGRASIAKLALAHRLPSCVWSREVLEAGALMSYGPDQIAIAHRVAFYADKILKGAKPADIPVEQPTKFEFLINQKTAKAIGITVPNGLLARADQVVQ
jgi:putative ABC transport system substrate-binding protein